MYFYKYNNCSKFYVNKKISDYLRLYQDNLIKDIFKRQTTNLNTFVRQFPPIEPKEYFILIPLTNILSFLAGYYSHYFLRN